MQIAPTALISFSISTNVTALQACYGFTMGWVINFCEPRSRHLVMPFINKCHPRYRFVRRGNKWNTQLSALCKSIFTPRCIFSLVCLLTRVTTEITMASKGKPTPSVAPKGIPFPSLSGWVRPVSGVCHTRVSGASQSASRCPTWESEALRSPLPICKFLLWAGPIENILGRLYQLYLFILLSIHSAFPGHLLSELLCAIYGQVETEDVRITILSLGS